MLLIKIFLFLILCLSILVLSHSKSNKFVKKKVENLKGDADNQIKNRKAKSKNSKSRRNVILPSRKVPLKVKALNSWKIIQQSLTASASAAIKTTSLGTKQAIKAAKVLKRNMKSYLSSDFEALLLRVTQPDENQPDRDDVERIIDTVSTFVRNIELSSDDNPYRVTLRKLWAKISEPDSRTKLKALYILHTLIRHSEPEDCVIFKKLLDKMSKEYSKKTNSLYFKFDTLKQSYEADSSLKSFVERYADYVLKRAKTFTSHFEEMKMIGHGMETEDICAQMVKAFKLIDSSLECKVPEDKECEATSVCLELIAKDIRQLFILYHEKLRWIIREEEIGDLFEAWNPDDVKATLTQLISYYNDHFPTVNDFLNDIKVSLQIYNIKIQSELSIPSAIEVSSNSDKPPKKNSKFKAIKFKNKNSKPDDVPTVVDIDSSDIENNI